STCSGLLVGYKKVGASLYIEVLHLSEDFGLFHWSEASCWNSSCRIAQNKRFTRTESLLEISAIKVQKQHRHCRAGRRIISQAHLSGEQSIIVFLWRYTHIVACTVS